MERESMKKYSWIIGLAGLLLLLGGLVSYYLEGVLRWIETTALSAGLAGVIFYLAMNFSELKDRLRSRSSLQTTNALFIILIVLVLLGLVNFVAGQRTYRYDTTAAKHFSLADQTVKVLEGLKKDLTVTAFYKDEARDKISDLLKEYSKVSSKFKFDFVDPDRKPDVAKRMAVTAYETTVLSYGAKDEKVTGATEEALTNALIKVTREGVKKVLFTTNHGEKSLSADDRNGLNLAQQIIKQKNYDVNQISLLENAIPKDCAVLVVAGAQTDFLQPEKDKLRAYLQNGGGALFMIDPPPAPAFEEILTDYGFKIGNNLIIDVSGIGRLFGVGANVPVVTAYENHPIIEKFGNSMTAFADARSVQMVESMPSGVAGQLLAKTSPNSWGEADFTSPTGRIAFDEGKDLRGPVPVAALMTKPATSDSASRLSGKTRIVVFGDSDFAANNFFNFQRNSDLFLSTISWLAEEEDLVSIRPHNPEDRRISLTAKNSKIIMLVSVLLLPLAALAGAVIIYIKRR
jgi:ABC-type uncharacterized transport system involved in gliding motility auxiliary subunit